MASTTNPFASLYNGISMTNGGNASANSAPSTPPSRPAPTVRSDRFNRNRARFAKASRRRRPMSSAIRDLIMRRRRQRMPFRGRRAAGTPSSLFRQAFANRRSNNRRRQLPVQPTQPVQPPKPVLDLDTVNNMFNSEGASSTNMFSTLRDAARERQRSGGGRSSSKSGSSISGVGGSLIKAFS